MQHFATLSRNVKSIFIIVIIIDQHRHILLQADMFADLPTCRFSLCWCWSAETNINMNTDSVTLRTFFVSYKLINQFFHWLIWFNRPKVAEESQHENINQPHKQNLMVPERSVHWKVTWPHCWTCFVLRGKLPACRLSPLTQSCRAARERFSGNHSLLRHLMASLSSERLTDQLKTRTLRQINRLSGNVSWKLTNDK